MVQLMFSQLTGNLDRYAPQTNNPVEVRGLDRPAFVHLWRPSGRLLK